MTDENSASTLDFDQPPMLLIP